MSTPYSYYSFLPFLRRGMVNEITQQDILDGSTSMLHERAVLDINVPLKTTAVSGGDSTQNIAQTLHLKGPGDVIGINSAEIVRVHPADWVTNFEPNYLPFIEFYDEDFPWRYTPAKDRTSGSPAINGASDTKLRPWLTLIVLEENEFTEGNFGGILPSIQITGAPDQCMPDERQMWAWAHVHVNDDIGNTQDTSPTSYSQNNQLDTALGILGNILKTDPDKALSRLMCPRRLDPNTGYHAFLIPTFEIGRKAGLGEPIGVNDDPLAPSWKWGNSFVAPMPYYYRWFFKTGAAGDFESLVRLLKPRLVGNEVGKRLVDLQVPGNPNLDFQTPANQPTVGLQGVLHPTSQSEDAWVPVNGNFISHLREILNDPETQRTSASPDPIVGPPIYGKWHAQQRTLGNNAPVNWRWIDEVNLDPRYRIFAGAGAEVVRKNQDKYMDIAWKQVGAVIEANRKIRELILAEQASLALYTKHLVPISDNLLLNLSGPVHTKVRAEVNMTVYKEIEDSVIPNTIFSGAFRKMMAPGSALMRSLEISGTPVDTSSLIQDINERTAVVASPYEAPAGMMAYDAWSPSELTSEFIQSRPTLSNFNLSVPGSTVSPPVYGPPSYEAELFVDAVASFYDTYALVADYSFPTLPALDTNAATATVRAQIDPNVSMLELARKQIWYYDPGLPMPNQITTIDTALAAPQIILPMYRELAALSTEWLMPGLNKIPDNSISLLEMSQKYIEAFMLGANYEMARELLWRGYPTDQRGTYFSFFWDYANSLTAVPDVQTPALNPYKDIYPIHEWRADHAFNGALTKLGENSWRFEGAVSDILVLTIRGELLRKFPGIVIYMQEAMWQQDSSHVDDPTLSRLPNPDAAPLYPIFSATLAPDIYFLGFDISDTDAKGNLTPPNLAPGYFFVFQERVSEIRFGADESASASQPLPTWNDLNWGNIIYPDSPFINAAATINVTNDLNVQWGRNAADTAFALMQLPVKLYVHANALIP